MENKSNISFSGKIPENYEAYLGSMLFEPYAMYISAMIKKLKPQSLLEIACGTGRLTKYLPAAAPDAAIVASDVSAAMIEYSKTKYPDLRVQWQVADAMDLPFENDRFDCVVEQYGIMFCKDKPLALRETYRVLQSGGMFIFSAWDKLQNNPVMNLCDLALPELFPVDTPQFFKIPYSYFDVTIIETDLKKAGFADIKIENIKLKGAAIKAADAARGISMGTPLYNVIMDRAPQLFDDIRKKFEETIRKNFGDEFETPLSAFIVTAKK